MKTLRESLLDLPLATRASEVRQIADCPMSYALRLAAEPLMASATFFALGEYVHEGIARSIIEDWAEDQTIVFVQDRIHEWSLQVDRESLIETQARTLDSMPEDAARMIRNFYKWVHPSSPERLPLFNDYHWPPKVEQTFVRTDLGTVAPVYGTLDAIFEPKDEAKPRLIVDFKGSVRKVSDSLQLNFYRLLIGEPEADACFVYLDRVQPRAVIGWAEPYPGDRAMLYMIQWTETVKAKIIETSRARAVQGRHCQVCPARTVCPLQVGTDASMAFVARQLKELRPTLVPLNIAQSLAS